MNKSIPRLLVGCAVLLLGAAGVAPAQEPAKLREIRAFKHEWSVSSLALSKDGKRVFASATRSAYDDAKTFSPHVKTWDIETGEERFTLTGPKGAYSIAVAASPDGKWIVTGSQDKALTVWDADTGKELRTFEGCKGSVHAVAVTPDGKHFVSGGAIKNPREGHTAFGELLVWDVATGKVLRSLEGHTKYVQSVALSPDGKHVVSGGADFAVIVWELATGKKLHVLKNHASYVYSVAFSPDGKRIASGAQDYKLMVWDAETGERLHTLDADTSTVQSVAFSPDSKRIASGGLGGSVKLWDAATGRLIAAGKVRDQGVNVVAFTPDGARIVSGNNNITVSIWALDK